MRWLKRLPSNSIFILTHLHLLLLSIPLFAMDSGLPKMRENKEVSNLDRFCTERNINKLQLQIASSEALWRHSSNRQFNISPLFYLFQAVHQNRIDDDLFEKMTLLAKSSPFFENLIQSSQAVKRHQLGLFYLEKNISSSEELLSCYHSRWSFFPFWKKVNDSFEFTSAPALATALRRLSDNQRIIYLFNLIKLGTIPPLTHLELIQLLEVFPMKIQSTVKSKLESGAGVFTAPTIFENELKTINSINTDIMTSFFSSTEGSFSEL